MKITLELDKRVLDRLKKYKFDKREVSEERSGQLIDTGYPKPERRYRMVFESFDLSVEEAYFWILNFTTVDQGHYRVYKLSDYFTSSEGSAFFGINQQRLGSQQDKVAQYLGTIANMIKSLFQLVRELRILDERLDMYRASTITGENSKGQPVNADKKAADKPSEISLKGYWIDLVEGGGKNPSSVYGLAREVGFTTLPDLFFDADAGLTADKVSNYMEKKLGSSYNRKVREVLSRKLLAYCLWKENTYKELIARKSFTKKYLQQHYEVIKLYTQWIKPYLRNIRRMTQKEEYVDHPQLIAAFENTMIEIEFLAVKPGKEGVEYSSCQLITFMYRTLPTLNYQQEGFNRGPIHVGRIEVDYRGYVWSQAEINNYRNYKADDDMDMLSSINSSIQAAYEALKDDLNKYLDKDTDKHLETTKPKKEDMIATAKTVFLQPVTAFFEPFLELLTFFAAKQCEKCGKGNIISADKCKYCDAKFVKPDKPRNLIQAKTEYDAALKNMKTSTWLIYFTYKKAHKLLHWT